MYTDPIEDARARYQYVMQNWMGVPQAPEFVDPTQVANIVALSDDGTFSDPSTGSIIEADMLSMSSGTLVHDDAASIRSLSTDRAVVPTTTAELPAGKKLHLAFRATELVQWVEAQHRNFRNTAVIQAVEAAHQNFRDTAAVQSLEKAHRAFRDTKAIRGFEKGFNGVVNGLASLFF